MNDTTKRFPRTMNEAFNCDSDPISGPYGKEPLWPVVVIAILVVIVGIVVVWSRV